MKVRMFPARNLGCIGLYSRAWALDLSRSELFLRLGMRTFRLPLCCLRWIVVPPAVVLGVWLLSVLLMILGG
jgi:hypothetical protein